MKRVLALLVSVSLFLVVIGCAHEYDARLEKTYETLRYEKRLDENLEKPADAKSNLATGHIYVRPPLGLRPIKEFGFNSVEPGKFDITDTFFDNKGGSLHIVARVEKPKAPATKKGPNPPQPKVPRGDFTADVLELLRNAYATDVETKPKAETKSGGGKTNPFKTLDLHPASKEVKVYLYGDKNSPAQVALIFEYPEGELKNISSKIDLCLGSFRVGEMARRRYAGQDEETGEGTSAPPTGVF
jgi:hypothetical protein